MSSGYTFASSTPPHRSCLGVRVRFVSDPSPTMHPLSRLGHRVTIRDLRPRLGGMLLCEGAVLDSARRHFHGYHGETTAEVGGVG